MMDANRALVTAPRRIVPGTTYLVTRRCSERRFFLRPSSSTNDIFLYILALAAQRYRVLVHAFCVLSNHAHLVVTDVDGRLPAFMQYVDSLVARAVNASLGRFEGFWASDTSYSAVEPLAPADVLAKMAYVLANPVAAGLVKRSAEWPGLRTSPEQIGAVTLIARRPTAFFDPEGYLPVAVGLELTVPSAFAVGDEFRSSLMTEVEALEQKHRADIASQGRRFLGVARVLAQSPFARPRPGGEPHFELKPRLAARDKWKRIEGLQSLKAFLCTYRDALMGWTRGARDVVFPLGTYLMRVLHGVQCAGAA